MKGGCFVALMNEFASGTGERRWQAGADGLIRIRLIPLFQIDRSMANGTLEFERVAN